jgi:EmrB/QacA subfamily drug resistance transporter
MTRIALPNPGDARVTSAGGRWILAAAILGTSVAGIDSSVMNVALPIIGRDLGASMSQLGWTITGYTLSLAALVLLAGALGDHFGRRRIFLLGVVGFVTASLLCAVAPDINALIMSRVLQGVGGALMIPASLAIIHSSFVTEDRPRAIGIWSGFASISTALAPFVGGWLLELGTWRYIFVINVPVAIGLVLISLKHVPESREAKPAPMDWRGSSLAFLTLVALTYFLTTMRTSSLFDVIPSLSMVVVATAAIAFIKLERRIEYPMLPPLVFRSRSFIVSNVVTFLIYGAFGIFAFIFTVTLETVAGYGPIKAGSTFLPITAITLVLSGPSGRLASRIGPRLQLMVGPALCGLAALMATRISPNTGYWTLAIPLECVFGLGIAATVAPLTASTLASMPEDHAGVASGVSNAVSRAAALLWIAAIPPLTGLTGAAYADPFVLQNGFRSICVICATSLGLAGLLAGITLRGPEYNHAAVRVVPAKLPHPISCH